MASSPISNKWVNRNGRTAKRGLFANGTWYCDCDTRLPAEKFQTKNGGPNQGRWFYTCQSAQNKKCGFFLWADEARVREEAAVLSNSRTEPGRTVDVLPKPVMTPKTPMRQAKIFPLTPVSKPKVEGQQRRRSRSRSKTPVDESYDWSSDAEDELKSFAEELDQSAVKLRGDAESPQKRARTDGITSSSHRLRPEIEVLHATSITSPERSNLLPETSGRPTESSYHHEPRTPEETPDPVKRKLFSSVNSTTSPDDIQATRNHNPPLVLSHQAQLNSPSTKIFALLSQTDLPANIRSQLHDLLRTYDMRIEGHIRGQEAVRALLKERNTTILELKDRITQLEREKETLKGVVAVMKADAATTLAPRPTGSERTSRDKPKLSWKKGGGRMGNRELQ